MVPARKEFMVQWRVQDGDSTSPMIELRGTMDGRERGEPKESGKEPPGRGDRASESRDQHPGRQRQSRRE